MATDKGIDFINKYKNTDVLKETWLVMYRKGHITLNELEECIELTEEEIAKLKKEQIDICPVKTTEQKLGELVTQVSIMDEIIANLTLEVL